MALTEAFREAVNSGNVRRVRIMMKDSFLLDPSFKEFKEMEEKAVSMQGLYDAHDGRGFEENQDNWDDNYMDEQMVRLISNFSHERISHVKDVVRHLHSVRPVAGTTQQISSTRTNYSIKSTHMSYEEKKSQDQRDGRYLRTKVATGTAAGAVVGGIVASTASVSVVGGALVGAALGAVVGGVVVAVVAKGGN